MAFALTKLYFFLFFAFICLALLANSVDSMLLGCPEKCGDLAVSHPLGVQTGYYQEGFSSTWNNSSFPKAILGSNIELPENRGSYNRLNSCQTSVSKGLNYYNVEWGSDQNNTWEFNSSRYTALMQEHWFNFTAKDLEWSPMHGVLGLSRYNLSLTSDIEILSEECHSKHWRCNNKIDSEGYTALVASTSLMSLAGCPDKCGDITIPYPFGTRPGCYRSGFHITCNESTTPPKAILGDNIEVLGINISSAEINVTKLLSRCNASSFSNRRGKFTIIFCDGSSLLYIPTNQSKEWYYKRNEGQVPTVLNWAIREHGTCLESHVESSINPACQSRNSRCENTTIGQGYLCKCLPGYKGNPYIPNGCTDIDELSNVHPCTGSCNNMEGSYECTCPQGSKGDGKPRKTKISDKFPYPAGVAISSVLGVAIFLGFCFLLATYRRHKRHIKEKEGYGRYYQMMADRLRVFSKRQIEIATNNFDESQILGTGGHGKVYMGHLEDNKPAAIKISKEVEEIQIVEFMNEILLLSQLNHKNIVRLIGCCVEVKVPILVYEFIPNGTLHDLLHGRGKNNPVSLGTRLKIALESAEALDYLHSSITRSILHGDFKSANILLEDDYQAKVSDFGASNLVPIDDTQVVKVVQGTRGYIDPEYVTTEVLSKKSDVYSFGVVLMELFTRKYAIFRDETSEIKHLASCFVSSSRKNKLSQLLDKDIVTNNEKVILVLQEASELAIWCVSVKGEDRPTMKQVMEKLQYLVRLQSSLMGQPNISEEPESSFSESTYYTTSETFEFCSIGHSSVLEIETQVNEGLPAA